MGDKRSGSHQSTGKKGKKSRKNNGDPAYLLKGRIDAAARDNDVQQGIDAFEEARRDGISLPQHSCHVLLHLFTGGDQWNQKLMEPTVEPKDDDAVETEKGTNGSGAPSGVNCGSSGSENARIDGCDVMCEGQGKGRDVYNYMKSHGIEVIEFTYTGLARMAMACGDHREALHLARECREKHIRNDFAAKMKPRLRTYVPALLGFCIAGEMTQALEIEKEMRSSPGCELDLTEFEFSALLQCAALTKQFECGNYILESMMRDITQVNAQTEKVIVSYFKTMVDGEDPSGSSARTGRRFAIARTTVCESDGVCGECGTTLEAVDLKKSELGLLSARISQLAGERERHQNGFSNFDRWLHKHGPYDIIIDGANVGFYGMAKEGIFNFGQIEAMMKKTNQVWPGKKTLLVLHNRRVHEHQRHRQNAKSDGDGKKNNTNSNSNTDPLTGDGNGNGNGATHGDGDGRFENFVEACRANHSIYATPTGSNDDWYWLYAAVMRGEGGMLVTNDEMRDHIFQTLDSPKYFQKWKDRHQIRFDINKTSSSYRPDGSGVTKPEDVTFFEPKPYTTCIQRSTQSNGSTWHFPIQGDGDVDADEHEHEQEWLCISPVSDE